LCALRTGPLPETLVAARACPECARVPETTTVQLERVQAAIAAIEGGAQSFSVLGRLYQRGDLKTLYDRERELLARAERETRGGARMRLGVPTSL
jgi:hypothetical protein